MNTVKKLFWDNCSIISVQSLLVCIVSGILLTFYYSPTSQTFQSVQEITYSIPFSWLIRSLHYVSAQICTITMLFHVYNHTKTTELLLGKGELFKLSFNVIFIYLCSFLGYILKGDQESIYALQVANNLLSQFPLVGKISSKFIFGQGENILFIYSYHCFVLPVIIIILLKGHIGYFKVELFHLSWMIMLSSFYYLIFIHTHDIPPNARPFHIFAPWFFWGGQFMLKHISQSLAGIVLPLSFLMGYFYCILKAQKFTKYLFYMLLLYILMGIGYRIDLWR
ncbi:MAG: cytochrome b N-terminal domain-containing protein [Desulfatiglandales bacterium]